MPIQMQDVLDMFCKRLCGSKSRKASHSAHQCASNFRSLVAEQEIILDLSFLADFYQHFFRQDFEFNHATDPYLGKSGFLGPHHLIRYYLKHKDLRLIGAELETGSQTRSPPGTLILKSFWLELLATEASDTVKEKVLKKARAFIVEYVRSLHKHNNQFVAEGLLYFAPFGEPTMGQIVARHFLKKAELLNNNAPVLFSSTIHEETVINLVDFSEWLRNIVPDEDVDRARLNPNFHLMISVTEEIGNGMDIWEGTSLIAKSYQKLFLEAYAAVPSTMEMVERSVKKARLCQRTGKSERAVTAYGIAGDGVSEACTANFVVSSYSVDMEPKRKKSLETAAAEGKPSRY
jgi:hypothetical protein